MREKFLFIVSLTVAQFSVEKIWIKMLAEDLKQFPESSEVIADFAITKCVCEESLLLLLTFKSEDYTREAVSRSLWLKNVLKRCRLETLFSFNKSDQIFNSVNLFFHQRVIRSAARHWFNQFFTMNRSQAQWSHHAKREISKLQSIKQSTLNCDRERVRQKGKIWLMNSEWKNWREGGTISNVKLWVN